MQALLQPVLRRLGIGGLPDARQLMLSFGVPLIAFALFVVLWSVVAARIPILFLSVRFCQPGWSVSTIIAESLGRPSIRVNSTATSATSPCMMKIFSPLTR